MTPKTKPQLLTDFVEGLNEMIGASAVMIHHHQDLRWHIIRESLEFVKNAIVRMAVNPITAPQVTKHEKKTQILLP